MCSVTDKQLITTMCYITNKQLITTVCSVKDKQLITTMYPIMHSCNDHNEKERHFE